ncbi:MAG: hypothetical protein ACFFCZ_07165 [Promethearchaeota archaeon]
MVSGGQIIVDHGPKEAVASTSISEAIVCISALMIYFLGGGVLLNISLTLFLLIGSLASVPFAVLTVKKISIEKFLPFIGLVMMSLGVFMLFQMLFF